MPAANCTDPVQITIARANGRVQIQCDLKYDGVSVSPNCDGTIQRVAYQAAADVSGVWYAHFPNARGGPVCYRIDPGQSGVVSSPSLLAAAGFSDRASVFVALDLDQTPPGAGERLLN